MQNAYAFQKLTPITDGNLNVYQEALDFVFANNDLKNIAITGAYSAGKSSILESYKKIGEKRKYIHISLAHFQQTDSKEADENMLEGKILNQLIHQIPPENIPQTNFKVKNQATCANILPIATLIALFTILFLYFTMFPHWNAYVQALPIGYIRLILEHSITHYAQLAIGLIAFCTYFASIYKIIKEQKNKSILKKINLQGAEIEIFAECNESYFDKYLNEVLYLFENSGADVVVFEDIDRFNSNLIFERLREINTLVNNKFNKKDQRAIRFFYLLRDDVFESKDRTKFFDYIVHIVPILDSSNSYEQFILHFERSGYLKLFDLGFLQGVSLYIDDMRVLKNIHNEFIIYNNRLKGIELDCNKMLSVIAYKNLFPKDFGDLQLGKGLIAEIFNKKHEIILSEKKELEERIHLLNERIQKSHNEHLKNTNELDIIYQNRIQQLQRGYHNSSTQRDIAEMQREKEGRQSVLHDKERDTISSLEHELSELNKKRGLISCSQLKELVTRENIDAIFRATAINEVGEVIDFNEIKCSEYFPLLKYLVREGHIDETYQDYMTYFYDNRLCRGDKIFLRSITDKKAREFSYRLSDAALVFSRIKLSDFSQEEILNFDLIDYLFQKCAALECKSAVIEQLKSNKNMLFISAYFDHGKNLQKFVSLINQLWSNFFEDSLKEKSLSKKQIREFSIYTINYSDDDSLLAINKNECLTRYISNSVDYLNMESPLLDAVIHGFELLKVKFVEIDRNASNKTLFDLVYDNCFYEINLQNLKLMLSSYYEIDPLRDIDGHLTTIIFSKNNSCLCKYIQANFPEYFDVILGIPGIRFNDIENILLFILNHSILGKEKKTSYIARLDAIIASLVDVVDVELWPSLLDNGSVAYSFHNVVDYYQKKTAFDSTLIAFINGNTESLDMSSVKDVYGKDITSALFSAAVICFDLSTEKYKQILGTLTFYYENFNIVGIPDDKLRILIDKKIIRMNSKTLLFLRKSYSVNCVNVFIRSNVDLYIDTINASIFSKSEMLYVLGLDISDNKKINLLQLCCDSVSVAGMNYSSSVFQYILQHNLDRNELPVLFNAYGDYDDAIKSVLLELSISCIDVILGSIKDTHLDILRHLLLVDSINETQKVNIMLSFIPIASNYDIIIEFLRLAKFNEFLKIFEKHGRPKIPITAINEKFLSSLKDLSLIKSYSRAFDGADYFKIEKRKSVKSD